MSEGRLEALEDLVRAAGGPDPLHDLCRVCTRVLDSAGSSLMLESDGQPTPLAWSDPRAFRIEELQQTLGEGPCHDAHVLGRSMSVIDLGRDGGPWTTFGRAALDLGVRAVFSFPLRVGGLRLGALTVIREAVGPLSARHQRNAQFAADVATDAILSLQSAADAGELGLHLGASAGNNAAVHQATGMISVQLGVDLGEALVRLRAHAFATGRPLGEVAADVVGRKIRLGPPPTG